MAANTILAGAAVAYLVCATAAMIILVSRMVISAIIEFIENLRSWW